MNLKSDPALKCSHETYKSSITFCLLSNLWNSRLKLLQNHTCFIKGWNDDNNFCNSKDWRNSNVNTELHYDCLEGTCEQWMSGWQGSLHKQFVALFEKVHVPATQFSIIMLQVLLYDNFLCLCHNYLCQIVTDTLDTTKHLNNISKKSRILAFLYRK